MLRRVQPGTGNAISNFQHSPFRFNLLPVLFAFFALLGLIKQKKRTSVFQLKFSRKSGDDLLSHKRNEVEFVGAGSNRSHAAWTEFMPVRVANRRGSPAKVGGMI